MCLEKHIFYECLQILKDITFIFKMRKCDTE